MAGSLPSADALFPDKPSVYPTTGEFSEYADKAFGKGNWKPTSEYRSPKHNAEVGGVAHSHHMMGDPKAPGAYDIVVPGMSAAQVGSALRKAGWKGSDYPESDHLHTNALPSADKLFAARAEELFPEAPARVTVGDIQKRLGPKPSEPSALDQASQAIIAKAREWNRRRVERNLQALSALQDAGKQMDVKGLDPITGTLQQGGAALEAMNAGFGYLSSPFIGAPLDVTAGPALSKALAKGPENLKTFPYYTTRVGPNELGDVATNVAPFLIPGAEARGLSPAAKAGEFLKEAPEDTSHLAPEEPPAAPPEPAPEAAPPEPPAPVRGKAAAKAARAATRRARNPNVATPEEVKAMQDANPSPFTHPEGQVEGQAPEQIGGASANVLIGEIFEGPQRGDLWHRSHEDLVQLLEDAKGREHSDLLKAFGSEERVQRFNKLDRMQNSMDPKRADEGSRLMAEEFGDLTPDQEALIYGYGDTRAQVDDIKEVIQAHQDVAEDDPHLSDDQVAYWAAVGARAVSPKELAEVPLGGGSPRAQAAYVRIQNAYRNLVDRGVDPAKIPHLMVRGWVQAGAKASDAAEIIGSFVQQMADRQREGRSAPEAQEPRLIGEANAQASSRTGAGPMSPEEAKAIEAKLQGADIHGVIDHVIGRTDGTAMGEVAKSVKAAITRLQKAGVKFDFEVVHPGDPSAGKFYYPRQIARGTQSFTGVGAQLSVKLRLASSAFPEHGFHDSTILHEMVHAVTSAALHAGRTPEAAGTDLAKTTAALDKMTRDVIRAYNAQVEAGTATINIHAITNTDELLAYGFTHEPFQRWLETIPYGKTNMWSAFVDKVRELLGMKPGRQTALSELLRHGHDLMNTEMGDFQGAVKSRKFGRVKRPVPQRQFSAGPQLAHLPEDPLFAAADQAAKDEGLDGGEPPQEPTEGGVPPGGGGGGYGGSSWGPGDIPPPGSEEAHGPVVGDEPDPVERLDNGLYRMGGAATADKLEALDFLYGPVRGLRALGKKFLTDESTIPGAEVREGGVPKELADPAVQERLSREIEKQIVDPSHQIPEDLQPAYQVFSKWRDEVLERTNRLRARRDPTIDMFLPETGHTPRRVVGHTPMFDEPESPSQPRDIVPGKRNLSPSGASSLHERTAGWMVQGEDGQLQFTQEKPADDVPHRIATMDEVEANTNIRYYRNPLVNTIDEALRLRRVERAVEMLDLIKKQMKDDGLAFHYEWHDPNGARRGPGEFKIPKGFEAIHNVPQLKGWAFHPEVAEVFKDYYPGKADPLDVSMNQLNRMLIGSLFITPIPHILNVGAHAVAGRGWDWLDIPGMVKGDLSAIPDAYRRGFTTSLRAMHEVFTKGPRYRQLLREGAGFMYGDTQVRNFLNMMLEKAGQEIIGSPEDWAAFHKQMDLGKYGINTPKDFVKLIYRSSNKSMWLANDVFLMQRIMELEEKGLDTRSAIKAAEKDIPNYRIPSRIFGSREFAQLLKGRNWLVFGRYKYGQWKALGHMVEDLIGKDSSMDERVDALGRVLVTGMMMMAIYPAMDKLLQEATGNKDARVRRAGPFAILDALAQFAQNKKDWATMMSSMFSPAPVTDYARMVLTNRDFYGRKAINAVTPLGYATQAFEFMSGPIYPLKSALEFAKPGGGARAMGRMFGLDLPPEGTADLQKAYAVKDKQQAASREAKDPLQQDIEATIQKAKAMMGWQAPAPPPALAPPPPALGDQDQSPNAYRVGPIP